MLRIEWAESRTRGREHSAAGRSGRSCSGGIGRACDAGCGGRGVAEAEAIDGLERHAAVGRGLAHRHAEQALGARGKRIAARGLARLGAAEFQHAPAGRLLAEVMIEGDGAVDLGAGQIERLGNERRGGAGLHAGPARHAFRIEELLLLRRRHHRVEAAPGWGGSLL